MKKKISAIIFTYNNEKEIKEIIDQGKKLTNEIIVIDLGNSDQTNKVAKELGAKVYPYQHSEYVELAREWGIKKAKSNWVLVLDADERIEDQLINEIKLIINQLSTKNNSPVSSSVNNIIKDKKGHKKNDSKKFNDKVSCFYIPRKNIFINKWLRYGGWWPDYQLRLINTQYFVSWPMEIHSTPVIKGKPGYLKNPIFHYFHGDLESMVEKTIKFENIESELLLKANRPVSIFTFFRKFLGELWRRMFLRLGFVDGVFGIIESIYQAFSKTITYLFLYEKKYIFKK